MLYFYGMEDQGRIPLGEIRLVFVRATGPGGQNVNKTSTKAQLHWDVNRSGAFSDTQKAMIRHALRNRMNRDGEVVIQAGDERSQKQNRETAVERLERLVAKAITPRIRRIATKPTHASRERRLEHKQHRSRAKQLRRSMDD